MSEQEQQSKPAGAQGGGTGSKRKERGQKGAGKAEGPAKLRGLPNDSEETRMSKTLTWVLRHGPQSEGLSMRSDGYVRVQDILARPRFKEFDFALVQRLVANDSKTRFSLVSEPDPTSGEAFWWIRANQGHSLKDVVELETTPVSSLSDIPTGEAVHGTTLKAWESIRKQGLSKMKRNHIHLAQGIPGSGVISGVRNTSQVYVYVDVEKAIAAGIKFGLSANGVILTSGNEKGYLLPAFFQKVAKRDGTSLLEIPISSTGSTLDQPTDRTVDEVQQKTEALVL